MASWAFQGMLAGTVSMRSTNAFCWLQYSRDQKRPPEALAQVDRGGGLPPAEVAHGGGGIDFPAAFAGLLAVGIAAAVDLCGRE